MTAPRDWDKPLTWPEAQAGEQSVVLTAGPTQRADIARRLDLSDLRALVADLTVRPWLDGVEIMGRVRGDAVQICGLTTEPFDVHIDEPVKIRVVPPGSPNAPAADLVELIIDLDAEDPPDVADSLEIDLAHFAVEAFALALDPFPRKPGAIFEPPAPEPILSPFAVLKRLADREPSK